MKIPMKMRRGQNIKTETIRVTDEIVDALSGLRPIAGKGVRIFEQPGGVVLEMRSLPGNASSGGGAGKNNAEAPFPATILSGNDSQGYVIAKYENGMNQSSTGTGLLFFLECNMLVDVPAGTKVIAHPAMVDVYEEMITEVEE